VAEKSAPPRPVAGICRDDIERFNHVLSGLRYPAQKWQVIAHAMGEPAGQRRTDMRTLQQLWALPAGHYTNLTHVLTAAARTARGHPHRI
jgi:hypothetical protein